MVVPAKRNSKSKVKRRRLHQKLKEINLVSCKKCNNKILPHRACNFCGYFYKE
jgi:large subunit ribosomal protein L32